jgi:hypothetical protein
MDKYYKVYRKIYIDNIAVVSRIWCGIDSLEYQTKQNCGDWQTAWKMDFSDIRQATLNSITGSYDKTSLYIYFSVLDYHELKFDDFEDAIAVFQHIKNEIGERK